MDYSETFGLRDEILIHLGYDEVSEKACSRSLLRRSGAQLP